MLGGENIFSVFKTLETLRKREVTGNAAINLVEETMSNLINHELQEIFELILKKDLKCGVNKKLIQKVFPKLITELGYMGAVPFDQKK